MIPVLIGKQRGSIRGGLDRERKRGKEKKKKKFKK